MRQYLEVLEDAIIQEDARKLALETRSYDRNHGSDLLPNGIRAAILYLTIRKNTGIPAVYEIPGCQATAFHDHGKLGLPDMVNEPRPLTPAQREYVMDPHAKIGERRIRRIAPGLHPLVSHTAHHHHTVFTGNYGGYRDRDNISPEEKERFMREHGISIEETELRSVIASSACDKWDAMVRDRAAGYPREHGKRNFSPNEIVDYIHRSTNSTSLVKHLNPIWMQMAELLRKNHEETSEFFLQAGLYLLEELGPADPERRNQLANLPYLERIDELLASARTHSSLKV